jgi:hypothetical protein
MLNYGAVRDTLKNADRLAAKNKVIAEWNMNKYQKIDSYGLYAAAAPHSASYSAEDPNIISGQNYIIYSDNSNEVEPEQDYLSELSSIFRANQPDPGIILTQKHKDTILVKNSSTLKFNNISPSVPRYYPFTEFRKYDYFNSAKSMKKPNGDIITGVSNASTGAIIGASPFVIYEQVFPCNKITVKVQNHISVPKKFSVEILVGSSWVTAYNVSQSSSADFSDGILNIYFTGSSWTKVSNDTMISPHLVKDFNQLIVQNPTQLRNIRGIRLSVYEMSVVGSPAGLEIIEFSPRLELDMSEYTESFNFNSSISDTTSFGLPVGSIVAGSGDLSLSNEDNQFLFSSRLSSLRMLSPDVKFSFFQQIDPTVGSTATIPLKVLYTNEWTIGDDYSVSVALEDGFKFLRETAAFDILIRSSAGIKLSTAALILLDNSGLNGFNFVTSSPDAQGEDVIIRNFFSRREKTVAEILQELAIAAQCSMFFDAKGRLNIITKERLCQKTDSVESTPTNSGTDFWMVFDENLSTSSGSAVSEAPFISNYDANVVSYTEERVNPLTEGEINYHIFGPRKRPGLEGLADNKSKRILEETVFPASLAFANFKYATQIVWEPGQDNDAALAAANLVKDLPKSRVKDIFTGTYTATDEEDAIRILYSSSNSEQKKSMVIFLDKNEGILFGPYQGYVLVDSEYIKYRGKLFHVSGQPFVCFSDEQFNQRMFDLNEGSSISFIGLIVDIEFNNVGQNGSKYDYVVSGDGRAKLDSKLDFHFAFVKGGNTGIENSKKYSLRMGGGLISPKATHTIEYDFLQRGRYKAIRKALQESGLLGKFNAKSYLGFLKLEGVRDSSEAAIIDKIETDDIDKVRKTLNDLNIQTDKAVPGNFDDYVFLPSEAKIYAQRIDIPNLDGPFVPNIVSTRMRLFSPRKRGKNQSQTMETISSIAGIAVNVNPNTGEGYYLEVEGVASGKSEVASESYINNLRFYKIFKNSSGKYEPYLAFVGPVAAYTVSNIDVQVMKNDRTADAVFELTVVIEKQKNGSTKFTVRYGDTLIGRYVDDKPINGRSISLFVRGDSKAIYEYISAGVRQIKMSDKTFFRRFNTIDEKIKTGVIPLSQQFLYKNKSIKYYFNDFAKLVREVKDFDIRFQFPVFSSTLIDVSKVNSDYMVKTYRPTAFGAKLIVANTAAGPILLTLENNTPLYIVGVVLEELSSGSVTMEEMYDRIDEKRKKIVAKEFNKSVFGSQTFTLDSQYIQSIGQASNLMQWVIRNCSRQRLKLNMEIFPNPLLELGDKVKVYDKTRGYNENNELFGQKTFVISSISHSVESSGPTMSVQLIEVGES